MTFLVIGVLFCLILILDDVNKTNFLKLLSMSEEDIQKFVVEPERLTLQNKLKDAEVNISYLMDLCYCSENSC